MMHEHTLRVARSARVRTAAEAWAAEIARRSREIERGTVRGVPWADVRAAGAARRARGRR